MRKRINNQLPHNLPQLQNCIKRDPESYKQEFLQQYNHYKALVQVFQFNPSCNDTSFVNLLMFLAQVSHCYSDILKDYPNELMEILRLYSTLLHPFVRLTICKALILMRNKSLLHQTDIIPLFVELFRCQCKELRKFLKNFIINDIKNTTSKYRDSKLNSTLQNFFFSALKDSNTAVAKSSLDSLIELYRKDVWKDAKTVNMIATCCYSKHSKLLVASQHFFLGSNEKKIDDSDISESEDESKEKQKLIKEMGFSNRVNKTTRKRKRLLERTNKVIKSSKKSNKAPSFNFAAIHLIYDPQGMGEKLMQLLDKTNHRFEIKLMTMDLISRLIGIHRLFIFNFYSLLVRFLQPHQREVTKILLFSAQAAHELIPPEVIEPLVKTIANNFITERNSAECMTVGLNSITEICTRCPLAIDMDLLQDLVRYKSYKNKNVSMAAKSLIHLYRSINPAMLVKKDRGKPTEATVELKPKLYGELDAKDYITGAEVLDLKGNEITKYEDNGDYEDYRSEFETEKDDVSVKTSDDDDNDIFSNEYSTNKESSNDKKMNQPKKKKVTFVNDEDELDVIANPSKAKFISTYRIFSQEEFEKVKRVQLAKRIRASKPKKVVKQEQANSVIFDEALSKKGELVSLSDIEKLYKKPKEDKKARLSSVKDGREERHYGSKKCKMNPFSSKTEKEKKKNKAFMMVKHKLKKKKSRSYIEKVKALKRSLIKKLKNK